MGFGPDSSFPSLNNNQVGRVIVPTGMRAIFKFTTHADWENAVCIYSEVSDEELTETRGNHGRPLNDFITPENNTGRNHTLLVTGWHKKGQPSGRLPWIQSYLQERPNSDGRNFIFGFEDAGDADYDDMQVEVNIVD